MKPNCLYPGLFLFRSYGWLAGLLVVLLSSADARDIETPPVQLAAAFQLPQVPNLSGPSADWRQFDSFYTFIVKRFGQDLSGELRDSLGDAFLDSRYELASLVGKGGNPVPQLFVNGWQRLSPILTKAAPGLPKQTAGQYSTFIEAADKLALVAGQGSKLGVAQISPDALRGLSRLVAPGSSGDPLAFTTGVDSALRNLLGFGSPLAAPNPSPLIRQSRLDFERSLDSTRGFSLLSWLATDANAAQATQTKLNGWVPDLKDLEAYLTEVRSMLVELSAKLGGKSKLSAEHQILYRQIVLTAAWQESCWRQYIRKGKNLTPLASTTGDLGLMQVNRNTWRNVYDLKGLGGDIEYNGNAGAEILLYYLSRHAIKKNEDKAPEGNLARATYSAYNGGPGAVSRYRLAKTPAALKKVDAAFWEKFQAVSAGHEMDVQRCYEKGSTS
jgi:hypothetical protein